MLVAYPRLKGYLESEIESGPCNFEKGNTHNSVVSPRINISFGARPANPTGRYSCVRRDRAK
ncbi:unnamed protein product, partial [Brassica rapa]